MLRAAEEMLASVSIETAPPTSDVEGKIGTSFTEIFLGADTADELLLIGVF